MREYDQIAEWYATARSPEVGLPDLAALAESLPAGARVLDLGCGTGLPVSQFLQREGFDLVALDSSEAMVAHYRVNVPGAPVRRERAQDADFAAGSFDAVVAWGVLFHLSEADQATVIRKVARWLSPGGRFVFTSGEAAGETTGEMNGVAFQYRSLGVERYRELLERAGMRLEHHHADAWENYVYVASQPGGIDPAG